MSEFPSPQSFPSDGDIFSSTNNSSSLRSVDHIQSHASFYPIDEIEDFYDPFSKLSLFLNHKIRREIRVSGTLRKWSSKIEAHLLKKILPEFKKQFPHYHLGAAALKRVWNKVHYYYEKMQTHRGALQKNGKLNLRLMIRENLRATPHSLAPLNLPPYHLAHQIATKIGECMAILEGKCPDLDRLAKVIWAVQKNRVGHLSPMAAKSPYEEYDKLDKLIVKALLEVCSRHPGIGLEPLKGKLMKEMHHFSTIRPLVAKNELSSTLAILLADKLCPLSFLSTSLTQVEHASLSALIDMQIQNCHQDRGLSPDLHCQEIVQRILAFYSVAAIVPKNIPDASLRERVREVRSGEIPDLMNGSLYIFIRAQMDLSRRDTTHNDLEKLEKRIVKAYHSARALPTLIQFPIENFELLIWKTLGKHKKLLANIPGQVLILLEKELGNIILDKPQQTFRSIVNRTTQFFKNVGTLPFHDKKNSSFWLILEKKSEIWALQNEMLCRWIHFDDHTPLSTCFKREWTDQLSIKEAFERALKRFPILAAFKDQLSTRLWVLQQYFWYSKRADGNRSPYEQFLKKYYRIFKNTHPEYSHRDVLKKLRALSNKMLPFTPFDADALQKK